VVGWIEGFWCEMVENLNLYVLYGLVEYVLSKLDALYTKDPGNNKTIPNKSIYINF